MANASAGARSAAGGVVARVSTLESSLAVCADATLEHTLDLGVLTQAQQRMQAQLTQSANILQQMQLTQQQVQQTQQQIQQQLTKMLHSQKSSRNRINQLRQRVQAIEDARASETRQDMRGETRQAMRGRSPRGRSRSRSRAAAAAAIEDAPRVVIGSASSSRR